MHRTHSAHKKNAFPGKYQKRRFYEVSLKYLQSDFIWNVIAGLDWIGLDWIGLDWIGLQKAFQDFIFLA